MLEYKNPIRFPFGSSEESEKHTKVSRRLFAYFLVGEKVGPRRDDILPRSFDSGFAYAQDDAFRGMQRLFELLHKPEFDILNHYVMIHIDQNKEVAQVKKMECLKIVPGCRTALLMIHGIMGKPSYFAPFLPLVPENMSVQNLLLDGHCSSLHDFCHSSMAKWRQQVFDALDALLESHEKVMIFGYSLGALFAVEAAVKYPDRVSHIFCTCLPLLMRIPPAAKIRVWRIMFDKIQPGTPTERMMSACGTQTTKKLWKYAGTAPRMAELAREMYRTRARVHHLKVPCRNYMGALDEMLSQRTHRYLEQFSIVTNTVLPHSGHFAIDSRDLPLVQKDFAALLAQYR